MKVRKRHIELLFFLSIVSILIGQAQVTKSDYFMKTSYLRNNLNPALQPERSYLVIPILPSIGANAQTNTFFLDNFTFEGTAGKRVTFMHQSVTDEDFLSNLRPDNYINTDVNIKLFGYGLFKNDAYWNFDLGVRAHVDANIPKPFFELLKKGFDQNKQSRYDLSDLSATGSSFLELGVSHSRAFKDNKLILGARAKLLGGLADFNLDARKLTIDAGPDYWLAKSRVTLLGSAPSVVPTYDEKGNLHGFNFGKFNIPGFGAGFDIGAEYDIQDLFPCLNGLKVSGALNDIGFIVWSKKNTISLQSSDTEVIVSPNDYEIYNRDGSSIFDVFEDALDDIKKAVNLQGDTRRTRLSMLRVNMNLGAEYELIKHKLSFGALYSIRFGNYFNISEFTFSTNYHPCSWFAGSLTYSVNHSRFDTFGMAMHLTPSKGINLFIASDYAIPHISSDFVPISSRALNFQLGVSIPLNDRK
ncbi:hypothetical protein JGH11_10290 [Dysgonomonas sp. Marseille-P4677]|uniref:DUF5723 family protein n=1 Tax=Dysgonomonas sp. Marseille-P4677 TaxID=2364790 RepID=UPI001913DADC|nr:DUF5723 family protein [Dysgonomonas sp. Marseille-P4677]MBK5721259.1 hypothetical protein [Dysgonomonas sp. Marseille-P4677]